MEKAIRGRPKKESNSNDFCRVCRVNLKVTYGSCAAKSCVNLFKPSARKEIFGVVLRDTLKNVGITVDASNNHSQMACNACYRKIKNLGELFQFIRTRLAQKREENKENSVGAKRKLLDVWSPTTRGSPHNRKSVRTYSPETRSNEKGMEASNVKGKKSLQFDDHGRTNEFFRAVHCNVLSKYNVDDLDTSKGAAVKVVISYPSGEVSVMNKSDDEGQSIIRNIAIKNWATVANACLRHELLAPEFKDAFAREVAKECKDYSKSKSCLKESNPDQLAVFSNKTVCKEVEIHCPLLFSALCQASNMCGLNSEASRERAVNAIALAVSALIRLRNPTMSAAAYRISTVLFHSGVSYKDFTRLNHLGICMSHDMMVALQQKMGENFDYKAILWRKSIEANKCTKLLVEEIREKQVPPREDDNMDLVLDIDISETTIKTYEWYSADSYAQTVKQLERSRQSLNERSITNEVLDETARRLRNEKLPFFK